MLPFLLSEPASFLPFGITMVLTGAIDAHLEKVWDVTAFSFSYAGMRHLALGFKTT